MGLGSLIDMVLNFSHPFTADSFLIIILIIIVEIDTEHWHHLFLGQGHPQLFVNLSATLFHISVCEYPLICLSEHNYLIILLFWDEYFFHTGHFI